MAESRTGVFPSRGLYRLASVAGFNVGSGRCRNPVIGSPRYSLAAAIADGCETLGLTLEESARAKMQHHLELLQKWNRRLNLTAVAPEEMVGRHLLDSLSVLPWLSGERVLDVGSGAGFPGLPVACARPGLQVALLDSRRRRVEFLRYVCAAAGIANAKPLACRVEYYRPEENFDTLLVRALAPLPEIVRLTRHLHYPGLRLVALKGREPHDELALIDDHGFESRVVATHNPLQDSERHLVILDFA